MKKNTKKNTKNNTKKETEKSSTATKLPAPLCKIPPLLEKRWFLMLTSAIIGAILFIAIYGARILDPTYEDWLFQGGDLTQHYLGWTFFRMSDWHFPFGLSDSVLGNVKISVIYTDSVPIFALFFKLLSPLLPATFQYFGFLGLFSFMMNGACSTLLIHRFNKNGIFCIIGSTFYIISPVVLQRLYGHEALSCHFVILLGLILWLYQDHKWKKKWQEIFMMPILWGLLGILAVSIHIYYLPMIYCFLLGCFITDVFKYKKYIRPFLCLISITALSLLMLWMLGAFYTKTNVAAQGLGIYSANINTFWNPLDSQGSNNGLLGDVSKGSRFLKPIAVNFGQYEGYAYVGFGIILGAIILLIASVCRSIKRQKRLTSDIREFLKNKKVWCIAGAVVFAVAMFYAISPSAYFNEKKIYDIYYSERIIKFMSSFRATGRYAWVGMYLIFTAVLYGLSRISRKKLMISLLAFCTVVQFADVSCLMSSRKWFKEEKTYTSPLMSPEWEQLAEGCDKLIGLPYDQTENIIYTLSIFAYKHNMSINHFHVARPPFDDILNQYYKNMEQISSGNADPKALYVFLSEEFIPEVEGAKVYELDGYYVVKFPGQ